MTSDTTATATTTRRRKKNDKVEPIDETLQEQQVQELREQALEQMELIHSVFSRLCEGAMFLSLILGVASQDLYCWIHVAICIFLHWSAISIVSADSTTGSSSGYQKYLPLIALVILGAVFIPQVLQDTPEQKNARKEYIQEVDHLHHMGLAGSNVVTMLVALYLKRDKEATNKQIEELEQEASVISIALKKLLVILCQQFKKGQKVSGVVVALWVVSLQNLEEVGFYLSHVFLHISWLVKIQ